MEPDPASDVNIIEADLDDPRHAEAVIEILDGYAKDIMGGGNPLPDHVRENLVDGLRRHPASMVFLAYQDRQPVGIAVCFLGFSTFAALPLINVHDLAVSPSMRRRGVGRRLLESAQERASRRCGFWSRSWSKAATYSSRSVVTTCRHGGA